MHTGLPGIQGIQYKRWRIKKLGERAQIKQKQFRKKEDISKPYSYPCIREDTAPLKKEQAPIKIKKKLKNIQEIKRTLELIKERENSTGGLVNNIEEIS